jgi:hypothetical protein
MGGSIMTKFMVKCPGCGRKFALTGAIVNEIEKKIKDDCAEKEKKLMKKDIQKKTAMKIKYQKEQIRLEKKAINEKIKSLRNELSDLMKAKSARF